MDAIDVSHAVVEEAARRHPELDAVCCDVRALPYDDRTFDTVVSAFDLELSVIEDAAFDQAAEQAVAALRSALRDCEVTPVHRQDRALPKGGKHQFLIPLASSQSRS